MSQEEKKGIRWWIFNRFGPHEVVNLIDHIDEMTEDGEYDIAIYPRGEFPFTLKTETIHPKPFVFQTPQERQAFTLGLNVGVSLFGGNAISISEEENEALELMKTKSTHSGGGNTNN